MKKINLTIWPVLFLLAIIVVLWIRMTSLSNKVAEKENFLSALTDTLKVMKNKDGSSTATIKAFQTSETKNFLALQTSDSTIKKLQKLVSSSSSTLSKGGTATVLGTQTNVNTLTASIVTPRDTVFKDTLVYIYPEYSDSFNLNGWVTGITRANKDSITNKFSIKDELDLVVGFNKGEPVAVVTSRNPYVTFTELRSINITTPKPKKIGVSINGGYGAALFSNQIKLAPYIGVGLSYNLFYIK